jgi:hypothetical protein
MEFWPIKIDWDIYRECLANGEFVPQACRRDFACNAPPDAGSWNAALSDYFPMLQPSLPDEVRNAIGPFVGAIATCGIADWPWPNDGPESLGDDVDMESVDVGLLYSPATVQILVQAFRSISHERLMEAISQAWTNKSKNPDDFLFSSIEHFESPEDFVEYVLQWFGPFEEAAGSGHGIGIGGG